MAEAAFQGDSFQADAFQAVAALVLQGGPGRMVNVTATEDDETLQIIVNVFLRAIKKQ